MPAGIVRRYQWEHRHAWRSAGRVGEGETPDWKRFTGPWVGDRTAFEVKSDGILTNGGEHLAMAGGIMTRSTGEERDARLSG